jgi:hypothetical protein
VQRKSILVLALVSLFAAGFLFAAAGCGGEKSSATETVTVTESTETESMETTETDTSMTETESMETDTAMTETESMETDTAMTETEGMETTDSSTSAGGFALANEQCQELANASAGLSDAFSGSGTADWDKTVQFLNELADEAPDEIADDFRTLAEAYEKIGDALGDTDLSSGETPSAAQIAALAKLGQELNQTDLIQASTNISTWMMENCAGVSPNG